MSSAGKAGQAACGTLLQGKMEPLRYTVVGRRGLYFLEGFENI